MYEFLVILMLALILSAILSSKKHNFTKSYFFEQDSKKLKSVQRFSGNFLAKADWEEEITLNSTGLKKELTFERTQFLDLAFYTIPDENFYKKIKSIKLKIVCTEDAYKPSKYIGFSASYLDLMGSWDGLCINVKPNSYDFIKNSIKKPISENNFLIMPISGFEVMVYKNFKALAVMSVGKPELLSAKNFSRLDAFGALQDSVNSDDLEYAKNCNHILSRFNHYLKTMDKNVN